MPEQDPYLESTNGDVRFTPLAVERVGGRMNWQTDEMRTLANEVIIENTGQDAVRLVLEGIALQPEMENLFELSRNFSTIRYVDDSVDIVTTFDEMRFDRTSENSFGLVEADETENRDVGDAIDLEGREVKQPMWSFQLQNKQNEDDDELGPSIGN